jgi:hypothetical protein
MGVTFFHKENHMQSTTQQSKSDAKKAADKAFTQDVELAMKKGPQYPKTDDNPEGYTNDEVSRRLPPNEKKSARGRKDSAGNEEPIKFKPIKDACDEMMRAAKKADLAQADYNDLCKIIAERSGVKASSLKRLVRASIKGNYGDVKGAIDQQAALFETIGEIPVGGETAA